MNVFFMIFDLFAYRIISNEQQFPMTNKMNT